MRLVEGQSLKPSEYPAMYQESDSCAISTQKKHFLLTKAKITSLLVVAAVAAITWNEVSTFKTYAAIAIGIILATLLVLTAIGDAKRFDRIWFNSRAIAESVKKETWLFIMTARPYYAVIPDSKAENLFLGRLEQIFKSQPAIYSMLTLHSEGRSQITEHMKNIRNRTVADRLAFYLSDRVRIQQEWYISEAKSNNRREWNWFIVSWVLQLLAVVLAFVTIFFKVLPINPIGIVTTAGAGVLSWMNARSYGELSLSYGLIAQRLSILGEQRKEALTEKDLSELVEDFEKAISTEHTIWLARRLETP
jgi:hypothetical protein